MEKKERENLKLWHLKAILMRIEQLLNEQRHNAGNCGDYATHSCNNGTDKDTSLTPVLLLESSTVYYNPSFSGYLIAIAGLIKQALFHKEREHFVVIWRSRRSP